MKDGQARRWVFPGAPKNRMGYLDDYMPPAQRKVVTPNNDTIYGAGFADLADDAVVIQTPTDVPKGHYWTIQIVDLFTTVIHQLGSASGTRGASFCWSGRTGRTKSREALSTSPLADQRGRRLRPQFRRAHAEAKAKRAPC